MTRRDSWPAACCRAAAASGAAIVVLSGCGTAPPPRFHTLMPLPTPTPSVQLPVPAGPLAWEVLPVSVPAQVDQPQWVVRTPDGSLAVLEQERWIAPLGEQIRAAVTAGLTRSLGPPAASAPAARQWRISIDVQRFDSAPGSEVRLEALWTLSSASEPAVALRCSGVFVQALADGGYVALTRAHRHGVAMLADAIGEALQLLGTGQPASCRG